MQINSIKNKNQIKVWKFLKKKKKNICKLEKEKSPIREEKSISAQK